ncbi:MAG: PKD repeat protein [Cyclobacteriaceae bacterium]|jgi:PKD repeat protein
MKKYLHSFLFIGLAILASCGSEDTPLPAPDASFFVQPSPVHVGEAVVFVNTSTNASGYEWDLGNGQVITQVSPIVTFETIGIVTVTLKAMSEDGQEDEVSQIVTVLEAEPDPILVLPTPDADFVSDPGVIEVGLPVMFENLTINASSYLWDFGNGETSTNISPTTTYTQRGTYTVKLTATTDDNQSVIFEKNIEVLERYFTGYYINIFPETKGVDSDGALINWDIDPVDPDGVFADLLIFMFAQASESADNSIVDGIFESPDAPLFRNIEDPANPIILTDEDWVFLLDDYDGPSDVVDLEQTENMVGFLFNPVQSPTIKSDDGTGGQISIYFQDSDTGYILDLDITFELR